MTPRASASMSLRSSPIPIRREKFRSGSREFRAHFGRGKHPLPAEAAARQQAKRIRKATKNGHKINPRTIQAAGFLMLLTSLAEAQPAERITELYRHRWQVEIGIKRLKTLGGLDELPSADPVLSRTWLLAHLIAAVLTDDLANEIVGFPPSAE